MYKPHKQKIIEVASDTVASLNQQFKKDHSITFTKALTLSNCVKEKETKTDLCRAIKSDMEKQWKETSVARYLKGITVTETVLYT